MQNKKQHRLICWRTWHKWVGVVFAVFILIFCVSGIILNHRRAFSSCEVNRQWLPQAYHIQNWNQNIIKGTLIPQPSPLTPNPSSIIAYGQAGVWITDRKFRSWQSLGDGIDEGIDNRKISGVVMTKDSHPSSAVLWCAALWDVYRFDAKAHRWQKVLLPENEERISDITLRGNDTIVVATRSALYEAVAPHYVFKRIQLKAPRGYKPEVSLFKTVWMLHSGQLFGTVGELVVDFIGLVIIILCLTGIIFFVLHYTKKASHRSSLIPHRSEVMRMSLAWHNKLGAHLIVLTLLLAVTGMCLRPPLMVPLVMTKTAPVPGSALDTDNAWSDKIRAVRWDERMHQWLISTSEGFYRVSDLRSQAPSFVEDAPRVSPMGITVFERNPADTTQWLIGSFSGLETWNPQTGHVGEWFADAPKPLGLSSSKGFAIPSTKGHHVTGFSRDLAFSRDLGFSPVVFEYSSAPCSPSGRLQEDVPAMPEVLRSQPMSLWNFALELHVGRCYEPFLGSVISVLFVFVSGLLLTLILVSGYIVYKR